jgi:hypothetical protein
MVRVPPGDAGSAASVVSVVGPTTASSTGSVPVAGATGTGRGAACEDVEPPNRGMVVLARVVLRVVVAPAVVTARVPVVGDAVPAVPTGDAVTAPDGAAVVTGDTAVVPVCGAAAVGACAVVVCAGVAVTGGGGAVVVGAAVVGGGGAAVVGGGGAAVVGGGGAAVVGGGAVVGPPMWPAT